ncbi:LOW QUALITY PROTEIN: mid1-interacting protein 1-like [Nerophis ophidion]|uniref:LOW QUALITY PROTEIN: mid1-interacting protein 1-like n=1 Tax=Nerophis ophidion TaxID=159077 RepID=UPI002AE0A70C|nr:LOW QUALITY PROTEIN: mid1-interacting protein 1-like [Nerophis ophidion]
MMQISSDPASNKHSLINVMHRFIAAANNMDETIMVPSLLRDMPLEEQAADRVEPNNNNNTSSSSSEEEEEEERAARSPQQRDMYEHYLLLKSIKNDMEWGLLKWEMSSGASFLEMAVKQEEQQPVTREPPTLADNTDLEHQFHFHLRGLFGVLSKLTVQADHLTNRYKREIGGGNFMR